MSIHTTECSRLQKEQHSRRMSSEAGAFVSTRVLEAAARRSSSEDAESPPARATVLDRSSTSTSFRSPTRSRVAPPHTLRRTNSRSAIIQSSWNQQRFGASTSLIDKLEKSARATEAAERKALQESLLAYHPRGVILDPERPNQFVVRPNELLPTPDELGRPPVDPPENDVASPSSVDIRHLGTYPQRLWIDYLKAVKQ